MIIKSYITHETLNTDKQHYLYIKRLYSLLSSFKSVLAKNDKQHTEFRIHTSIISTLLTGREKNAEQCLQLIETCKPYLRRLYYEFHHDLKFINAEVEDNNYIRFFVSGE